MSDRLRAIAGATQNGAARSGEGGFAEAQDG
jgi:hypothetical protein